MQTPGSSVPPFQAATVAGDLYKPCACLRSYYATLINSVSTNVVQWPTIAHAGDTR
jgi:hypothetical protein